MKVWFARFAVAGFAELNVLVIAYVSLPPAPVQLTLGQLAESGSTHRGRRIVVSNCVGGKGDGRWLVFNQMRQGQEVVVMERKSPSEDGPVLGGWCYGLRLDTLPGCPEKPPFIYVAFVTRP